VHLRPKTEQVGDAVFAIGTAKSGYRHRKIMRCRQFFDNPAFIPVANPGRKPGSSFRGQPVDVPVNRFVDLEVPANPGLNPARSLRTTGI